MIPALALLLVPSGFAKLEARFVGGVAAIEARIAPDKKAWFLLDTGSPESVYNGPLPQGWPGPLFKIGERDFSFPTTQLKEFVGSTLPGSKFTVSGMVGCDFLRLNQVLFDATRGEVWMRPGSALTKAEAEFVLRDHFPESRSSRLASLPLAWDEEEGRYRVGGLVGGRAVKWTFDTGANFLFADPKLLSSAKGIALGGQKVANYDGNGQTRRWLLSEVYLGSERIALPIVNEDAESGEEGILGMAGIARSALVDLPGRTVYWLVPTSPVASNDATIGRLFGLLLRTTSDGRLLFDAEIPKAPKEGATLLSIQGEPVASLRRLVAAATAGDSKALSLLVALYQDRDRAIRVTLSIDGKPVPLTIPH